MSDSMSSSSTSLSSSTASSGGTSGGGGGIGEGQITPHAFIRETQKQHEELLLVFRMILKVVKAFAHAMSYPAVILFRRKIGERMLSRTAFVLVWLIGALVAIGSGVNIAYGITLLLPVMYGVHAYQIKRRKREGVRHYSYCRGSSWLDILLPRHPQITSGTLEPLILIVAAIGVYFYGDRFMVIQDSSSIYTGLGSWVCSAYLAAMGTGLCFVEARLRKQARNMLLDHIDQQIISTYFASALGDNQEIVDEGFSIAELAHWSPEQRSVLAATGMPVFSGAGTEDSATFDPAWDNLLDPTPAPGPTPGSAPGRMAGAAH